MARIETFSCDQCGVQKKDANHWWKVAPVSQDGKPAGLLISKWNTRFRLPALPEMQAVRNLFEVGMEAHLCGESCVSQWVSKHLTQ